jgi:hypothetical protein
MLTIPRRGRVENEVQISGLRYESPGSEVIPDSEEERQRCIIVRVYANWHKLMLTRQKEGVKLGSKVIIISSDER